MSFNDELFGIPSGMIMDPVHGGIPYYRHEANALNHPLTQRLHHILQNDVQFLVFPGAVHTRFQHSLGVMHIAGKLFKSIIRQYLVYSEPLRNKPLTKKQRYSIQYLYLCVRSAALFHDLGHGPFSHQFESNKIISKVLSKDNIFNKLWKGAPKSNYYNKERPEKLKHEHYSVRCAYEVLKSIQLPLEIRKRDILNLMETTVGDPSDAFVDAAKTLCDLLITDTNFKSPRDSDYGKAIQNALRTIISGEFDVDKMDYLLRDSYFSGCRYGEYNLDHLLTTAIFGFWGNEWYGLAIKEKGIPALEDFIYSRFQLYMHFYSHKTVVGFKWLLDKALMELLNESAFMSRAKEFLYSVSDFYGFTDAFIWEGIHKHASSNPKSAAARLLKRKRLKCLYTVDNKKKFELQDIQKDLETKWGKKVVYHTVPVKFSKLAEGSDDVRVLVNDSASGRRKLRTVSSKTNFFEKYRNVEITHFYKDPFKNKY